MGSATPESRDGDSHGDGQDPRDGRDHDENDDRHDDRDREDDQHDERSDGGWGSGSGIELDSELQPDRTLLKWAWNGPARNVAAFEIYRSINEGAAQLIARVGGHATSYLDDQYVDSGSYTYFVIGILGSNQQSQSNSHLVLVQCDWISVSPFGNPPILFHPECSPIFSKDT